MSLVSIVIVNWNGESVLSDCLKSLLKLNHKNFEIILVDNGSKDNSTVVAKQICGQKIKVISLPENIGFAAGVNIGIKNSNGDFIATLNNDMEVEPAWLDQPLEIFRKNDKVGIVSCRQMNFFDKTRVDGLYHYITRELVLMPYGFGKHFKHNDSMVKPGFVISANGGSAIIRAETIRSVGLYDESFFGYMEETDFCMRAFLRGWVCVYAPDAVVYHKEGFSFKKTGGYRYYLRERNRLWFLYKNVPIMMILQNLVFVLLMELRIIRIFALKLKQPQLYFRSRFDALAGIKRYRQFRVENLELFKSKKEEFIMLFKKKKLDFSD